MGEILGLGLTHFPPLAWPDEMMDRALQFALADPAVPDVGQGGRRAGRRGCAPSTTATGSRRRGAHRSALVAGCARIRAELDEFAPDVVVIWGDDQYELFREDVVPAFCVIAADELEVPAVAIAVGRRRCRTCGRNRSTRRSACRGHAAFGRSLAAALLDDDVDVAYSYGPRTDRPFPHAIANTVLFLDYDRDGFPHPVVPMTVNCYGRLAIGRRGGMARFAAGDEPPPLDPPSPSPRRCIDVGRAVARAAAASDLRVALVASSSWSHGFLHDAGWRMCPDNRRRPRALRRTGQRRPHALARGDARGDRALRSAGDAQLVLPARRGGGGGARPDVEHLRRDDRVQLQQGFATFRR